MSAYINVEERNLVFAELKGELYKKFRKENISIEWCLKTEKLLTYAISKSRTQKDIDTLRDIIMLDATAEEKQAVASEVNVKAKSNEKLKGALDKVSSIMKKPLCSQGGYADIALLGGVTVYTTVMGIVTLLSEMLV